jgi:hypothetical protein
MNLEGFREWLDRLIVYWSNPDRLVITTDLENELKQVKDKLERVESNEWINPKGPPKSNKPIIIILDGFYDPIFKEYYYISLGQMIKLEKPKGWMEIPK